MMRLSNLSVLFVLCFLAVTVIAQPDQFENLEERVDKLLQKRDLGELANELARPTASKSIDSLLIKLSVFGRAGHRTRVNQTLLQLAEADDFKTANNRYYIKKVALKAIGTNDLVGLKIYFDRISADDYQDVSYLIWSWERQGDLGELEKWLEIRADKSEILWQRWVELRERLGTAQEIYDELADAIRQNPSDIELVRKYLRAVGSRIATSVPSNRLSYVQDVAWLGDVVKTDLSYEAYELAILLKDQSPPVGAKLLEKSLSLPFTQKDSELFGQRAFRMVSVQPPEVNPEKQLRYWTKTALINVYQDIGQPHLAQPLAEDLVGMDTSDIQAGDTYRLAGAVQAASGHRVIETKILQDEAANQDSPRYWINRAVYYKGRGEYAQTWQTLMSALDKFPYKPNDYPRTLNDYPVSSPRLWVLNYLRAFGHGYEDREKDTENILRREILKARSENDGRFIFELTQLMDSDFEDLYKELFVNTDLLPLVMNSLEAWNIYQKYFIEDLMEDEKWNPKKREIIWDQLTVLARKDLRKRGYSLAEAMGGSHRSIPIFVDLLKIAPMEYEGNFNFNRSDVEKGLFYSYTETGDWQNAEKMYFDGLRDSGFELGQIAFAAAKANAPKEALRVWKINANLDRRNMTYIEQLSKTTVKPLLREFYLEMKRRDPLTDIPAKALALLD